MRAVKWILKFGSYYEKDDIFHQVERGFKTIETRPVNNEKKRNYSQIAVGDKLILWSLDSGRKLERAAEFVHVYRSVKEMAEHEDVGKIFPGVQSPDELVRVFENLKIRWGTEYARKLEQFGVVAIGMKETEVKADGD
jgi:ASC-1-like (ASCH) protein